MYELYLERDMLETFHIESMFSSGKRVLVDNKKEKQYQGSV